MCVDLVTPAQALRTLATFRRVADANDPDPATGAPGIGSDVVAEVVGRLVTVGMSTDVSSLVDGADVRVHARRRPRPMGERDAGDATAPGGAPVEALTRMSGPDARRRPGVGVDP